MIERSWRFESSHPYHFRKGNISLFCCRCSSTSHTSYDVLPVLRHSVTINSLIASAVVAQWKSASLVMTRSGVQSSSAAPVRALRVMESSSIGRAPGFGPGGCRFESCLSSHQKSHRSSVVWKSKYGAVALPLRRSFRICRPVYATAH